MKLAVVGVGNAGSRIVNQIRAVEETSGRNLCDGNALLINSTPPSFDGPEHVPTERRLTIGDVNWEGDHVSIDGDPETGAAVAREERNEIIRAFDLIEFTEVDGVLVVAGLGGGTGGGAGSVVLEQLSSICDEPIYAVGVLPSESEGQRRALTAARALQSFVGKADNVILFDNETWLPAGRADWRAADGTPADEPAADAEEDADEPAADTGGVEPQPAAAAGDTAADVDEREGDVADEDGAEAGYAHMNTVLAERLVALFGAGEFDGGAASENQLDPSDIIRTLRTGGVSTIGYASVDLPRDGWFTGLVRSVRSRLPWVSDVESDEEDQKTDAAKLNSLVRRAARSKLTTPCDVSSADRALIVLSGPSRTLSRKGFESGRYWLEREAEIVDVMAGDEPHDDASTLSAVVLFSNATEIPRIDAMQELAVGQQPSVTTEEWRFGTANLS